MVYPRLIHVSIVVKWVSRLAIDAEALVDARFLRQPLEEFELIRLRFLSSLSVSGSLLRRFGCLGLV